MDYLTGVLGMCNTIARPGGGKKDEDENASEVQLNAFEFRNYRTVLEEGQQKLLERVVNHWCTLLVKGKTLTVSTEGMDAEEQKVYLDKDMLMLILANGDEYPLRFIRMMNMSQEEFGSEYILDIVFEHEAGEHTLSFTFVEERQRVNFALTLRILRSRDPRLDPTQTVEVHREDDNAAQVMANIEFRDAVRIQHFGVADSCLSLVFSVSDMKIFQKLSTTSRHVYLEFFVRYPHQEKFMYAKSPTEHIPSMAVQTEELGMRRKGRKDRDDDDDEAEKRKNEAKKQLFGGQPHPIAAMRFDLKNVKLKLPKLPHTLFGRLMSKDDYFPTAIGVFECEVKREYVQDRRANALQTQKEAQRGEKGRNKKKVKGKDKDQEEEVVAEGQREEPATLQLTVKSAWKVPKEDQANTVMEEGTDFAKIGMLTIRLLGYLTDVQKEEKDMDEKEEEDEASEEED